MKIRTGQRVAKVVAGAGGFEVVVAGGERVATRQVTAATSGFGAPYRLASSELKWFAGVVLHVAGYSNPARTRASGSCWGGQLRGTDRARAGGRGTGDVDQSQAGVEGILDRWFGTQGVSRHAGRFRT